MQVNPMRVTMLGCGGSEGVPVIGGNWGACDPTNPKNRRTRVSVMVETGGAALLIDTSPDLRMQFLDNNFSRIDAVLWTHAHADHSHGIADLREVCRLKGAALDGYAAPEHLEDLQTRFAYCFEPLKPDQYFYRTVLTPHVIDGPFTAAGVPVTPIRQNHGYGMTLGFRIGGFAYSTDVVSLDDAAFAALEGLDLWIVDCLRESPAHPTHAHLPLTLSWIERVKPKRAVLTHMNMSADYETLRAKLPPGVEPGYDGLTVELPNLTSRR
jgi:phosphoribosyl 1,2-cyclic phosphate phosphodiesterase